MDRMTLAALAVFSLFGVIAAADEFHSRPDEATLRVTERLYRRAGVEKDWHPIHVVGNHGYRIEGDTVIEVAISDKPKQRKVSVPADYRLRWLGAAEGIAFIVADRDVAKLDPDDPKSNRVFHRLDLDSMEWLDPFKLPEPSIKSAHQQRIFLGQQANEKPQTLVLADHLLVTLMGVVVLSAESDVYRDKSFPDFPQRELIGYHVSCYSAKETDAKWDTIIRNGNPAHRSVGFAMSSVAGERLKAVLAHDNSYTELPIDLSAMLADEVSVKRDK